MLKDRMNGIPKLLRELHEFRNAIHYGDLLYSNTAKADVHRAADSEIIPVPFKKHANQRDICYKRILA